MTFYKASLLLFVALVALTNARNLSSEKKEEATRPFIKKKEASNVRFAKEEEATKPFIKKEEATKLSSEKEEEATKPFIKEKEASNVRFAKEEEATKPFTKEEEATKLSSEKEEETTNLSFAKEEETTNLSFAKEEEASNVRFAKEEEATNLSFAKKKRARMTSSVEEEEPIKANFAKEDEATKLPYTKQEIYLVAENFKQLFAAYSARQAPLVFSQIVVPIADFLELEMNATSFLLNHRERLAHLFAELPESDFFLRRIADPDLTRAFFDAFVASKEKFANTYPKNYTPKMEGLERYSKWAIRCLWRNVLLSWSARRILRCPILEDLATVQLPALSSGVALDEKAKKKIVTVLNVVPCTYSLVKKVENEAAIRAVIDIIEQYGHKWKDHLPQ